jgi:hypothetical protein
MATTRKTTRARSPRAVDLQWGRSWGHPRLILHRMRSQVTAAVRTAVPFGTAPMVRAVTFVVRRPGTVPVVMTPADRRANRALTLTATGDATAPMPDGGGGR